MPFTDEEKRLWHEEEKRERRITPVIRSEPIAVCVHCQNPLGINEGVITPEVVLCDVCNGD